MQVQRMLNMNRGLYTDGNFKQNTLKKKRRKIGTLFAIMI